MSRLNGDELGEDVPHFRLRIWRSELGELPQTLDILLLDATSLLYTDLSSNCASRSLRGHSGASK